MARKRKTGDNLSDTGTSSVANRLKAEAERQETARQVREEIMAETKAAQRKSAKFLENKPTDTRGLERT